MEDMFDTEPKKSWVQKSTVVMEVIEEGRHYPLHDELLSLPWTRWSEESLGDLCQGMHTK